MSDLTFNKVAGAVLATGLAIVGLRELSAGVFAQEKVEKPGYAVEVAEEGGEGAAKAEAPIDWGTVLPAADVAAGEAVFAKCKSCHNADQGGPNGTGPNLYGVEGRKPGSHPGFAYSPAMTDLGSKVPQWDFEHLNQFISGPQKYLNGTKMTFVGLKKPEERIALIAWLRQQNANPPPIPAPDPSRQPGATAEAGAAPGVPPGGPAPEAATTVAAAGPTAAASATGTPAAAPTGAPANSLTANPTGQTPASGAAAAPNAVQDNPGGKRN
jgi:cytochrome c